MLSPGARPVRPPIPGIERALSLRDIEDTDALVEAVQAALPQARGFDDERTEGGSAVVIGGGLLGLEAANGLKLRGMDVTVVHLGPWLLERQLDEIAGKMLQKSLEDKGLVPRRDRHRRRRGHPG